MAGDLDVKSVRFIKRGYHFGHSVTAAYSDATGLEPGVSLGAATRSSFFDSCGPFKEAIIAFIGTVAKLERVKISERTKAGLVRARLAGKKLGRPRLDGARAKILTLKAKEPGISIRKLAVRVGVSKATVERTLGG